MMSITPKEAYEAAKSLYPGCTAIYKANRDSIYLDGNFTVSIDWGDTEQYPLPEPEWVDAVFPDDVGKEGRFSDDGKHWVKAMIRGQYEDGGWVGTSDAWKFCQVRKVKT